MKGTRMHGEASMKWLVNEERWKGTEQIKRADKRILQKKFTKATV